MDAEESTNVSSLCVRVCMKELTLRIESRAVSPTLVGFLCCILCKSAVRILIIFSIDVILLVLFGFVSLRHSAFSLSALTVVERCLCLWGEKNKRTLEGQEKSSNDVWSIILHSLSL